MTHADSLLSVEARVINWGAGNRAVEAAALHAHRPPVCVNIPGVDVGGNLSAFLPTPGGPLLSIEIGIDKAYTPASFFFPTNRWREGLLSHSETVRPGIVRRPRFIAFGGDLPIVESGHRIGGIGVSGGTEEQDEHCAQAGLSLLGLTQT
uniref:Heme-binding protein n=1 Tax=Burkholderia cepacia TaxID=292 RepID=Q3HW49_BURCE|nr:unknown [Burkholderia cepacia]